MADARTRSAVVACAALALALGSAPHASAATIAVTTEADALAADGQCSLREAISSANDDVAPFPGAGECAPGAGGDTVALPGGTFELSLGGMPEDANVRGDLDVLGTELTIAGAGSGASTIDANGIDRVIDVRVGRIATIREVKITGGSAPDGSNGTNRMGSGNGGATGDPGNPGEPGGGIRNLGTLTVLSSAIDGNEAGGGGTGGTGTGGNGGAFSGFGDGGDGGPGGAGGGIFNSGVLTVTRSTVTANTAGAGGEGGFGQGGTSTNTNGLGGIGFAGSGGSGGPGGGIGAGDGATTTIQDSTITANAAGAGGDGGLGQGGGGGPSGEMSSAPGGGGGQGQGAPGGFGGGGGGIGASGSLVVTGVLFEANSAGAGGDGGNGQGTVGGPAIGTGNGGNGGMGRGSSGGDGGSGGGVLATSASLVSVTFSVNGTGPGGTGGNGTGGQGGGSVSGTGGNGAGGDAGDGGDSGSGGAVRTTGASTIRHATMISNGLAGPGGPGTGTGGAAGNGGGGAGSAGSADGGSSGTSGSGGAVSATGPTTLANSIASGNAGPGCGGTVNDGQHNVVFPDASCPGANVDPKLRGLDDNGGPTKTSAIGPDSPAFDAVPPSDGCAPTDQRGVIRPYGPACDAGAYEWAAPSVVTGQAVETSSSSATLQGTVNPNARATSFHFEFGTTTAYGTSTPAQSTGAGTAAQAVEAAVGGLAVGVTYHYRLVASNADGTTFGEDRTFVIPDRMDREDREAPRFLSASLAPKVFAVNRRGRAERPVAGQRRRRGTKFRFSLSEPARVVFRISRARPGRRVGRRCVKPTRRNRARRRCTRYVRVRSFAVQGGAGANTKRFSGKIGRRPLKPGRYRATLVATDAAGNRSAPKQLRFRVVRARQSG